MILVNFPFPTMSRFNLFAVLAGVFTLSLFSGCLCDPDYCRYPNLLHPGHISEQTDRMKRFDPYTSQTAGPKIEGDRPHGADKETPLPQFYEEYKSQIQGSRYR